MGTGANRRVVLVAAVTGLTVLVVLVAAIVVVLAYSGAAQARPGPQPGPRPQPSATPPAEGSLRQLVESTVGPFRAVRVEENPSLIQAGASDALAVAYEGEGGSAAVHEIAALGSPEQAQALVRSISTQASGGGEVERETIKNQDGELVGTLAALSLEDGSLLIAWSNQKVFLSVVAPSQDDAVLFFSNSRL